jgi:uncharacterized protein (TIGR02145 family)
MKMTFVFRKIQFTLSLLAFIMLVPACKKEQVQEPVAETGTVTDVDGNVYRTIKIGTQWWMAENLRVTKYRDGSKINVIVADAKEEWKTDTAGAYTEQLFLYNWYAVNNVKNIAPAGWHIPSDDEWKELERQLGMTSVEADKTGWRGTHEGEKLMKENEKVTYWTTYGDVWPTNTSGFSALPDGCRFFDGSNGDGVAKQTGFWWSSTKQGNEAWYRYLDYKNKNVFRYHGPKTYGFSVRCVLN